MLVACRLAGLSALESSLCRRQRGRAIRRMRAQSCRGATLGPLWFPILAGSPLKAPDGLKPAIALLEGGARLRGRLKGFAGPFSGRPRPARLERVLTRSLGPSSIPSLGDGVMLGTAWIDRPVDTRGCTPASTSLPCSMEVQPCPCHLRPVIRLRH